MFVNPLNNNLAPTFGSLPLPVNNPPVKKSDDSKINRYLNFIADYTGCGHWRMLWPEQILNSYRHCVLQSSTVMITDPKHFHNVNCVRVQRQATETQFHYLRFLKEKMNVRLIYEIDDICFGEDIPQYNAFRDAFVSDKTRNGIQAMMEYCDEMTVTNSEMKKYYSTRTGQKNITIIPNYPPKFWLGRLYDYKHSVKLYEKYRKKPRVLYAGSSSHFDLHNKNNQQDDITHIIDNIIETLDDIQWVFMGGHPAALKKYIDNGKIEYHKWSHLIDYPEKLKSLNINAMVAPLADNIFNKCKSNIKFIEGAALGIPVICQDLPTYNISNIKFKTGKEMVHQLTRLFNDKKYYTSNVIKNYDKVTNLWLENENNRKKYHELYEYSYGTPNRLLLNKINDSEKDI